MFLKTIFVILLSSLMAGVASAQSQDISDLIRQAVEQAPSLQIAEANLPRATQTALKLRANPYEYQISASAGQRFIDDPLTSQNRFTEFGAGVSRTIRLPNKKRLDSQLADIEIEIAAMALKAAKFDEAKRFVDLWGSWAQAENIQNISRDQAERAEALAALEQDKVDKGAGRQIDADLSKAEAEMVMVRMEKDSMNAATAKLKLQSRYPDLILPQKANQITFRHLQKRTLSEQKWQDFPNYQLAVLKGEKLRLEAKKLSLRKRPDPTLGLDVTDEFGGRETSIMARISIPIGGKYQKAETREAKALANIGEVEARLNLRSAQRDYEIAVQSLKLSTTALASAKKAEQASLKALGRLEQGHKIGAVTLTDLLKARRDHGATERLYVDYIGDRQAAQLVLLAFENNN